MDKQDTISKIYYDRAGFGSIQQTLKEAKEKDKSITLNDVKEWFKENVEQKKQLRGYNSFVAKHAYFEFQADLLFITDLPNQDFKIGLLVIDIFTKYMTVIPMKTKQEGDVLNGLSKAFENMKSFPQILYTDDEGALNSNRIQKYLKDNNIKHIVTRGHAAVAERAIRTFKAMLYKRVEHAKDDNVQWTDFILEILLTYNNKLIHSTTGYTPAKAKLKENEMMVWSNTFIKAKRNRKYPTLEVGDKVKIYRKKKNFEKERISVWSENVYEVESIIEAFGLTFYKVNGMDKEYSRNELLKM